MKYRLLTLFALMAPIFTFSQEVVEKGLDEKIDEAFKPISDFFSAVIFFNVWQDPDIPFVLVLLVASALFFTIYFGFPNVRFFGKAINTVRGKYEDIEKHGAKELYGEDGIAQGQDLSNVDIEEHLVGLEDDLAVNGDIIDTIRDESSDGEVSHFQALATAVSGTVGNGNIAGVALAIALGGPGATFWMIVCGLLGMSTKFVECTLGVQYRDVGEDGTVYGGPMYYLSKGLKERGFQKLGKVAAVIFAIFCIGGSFGGGNAAQSNQATIVLKELFNWQSTAAGAIVGLGLAILVGIIIIGGIKRIAQVTEKVVPFMAIMYVVACLYIIFANFNLIDDAVALIVTEAFNPKAIGVGGVIGVLLVGFKRAAFSNEAGAGSASIAHSAVRTKYSASEGLVALLEPFIDTVLICTMTALVIVIFNFGGYFEYGLDVSTDGSGAVQIGADVVQGAGITAKAFAAYIPYSNVFLTIAVVLFAVSTMISWSYYGLQSWKFLFGRGKAADLTYKFLFLTFVVIGAAASMGSIWAFSDAMIFAMVFPNMVGLFFLFPVVKKQLKRYLDAIKLKYDAIDN
ncbi:alanine/glycine:cation symporter family protein [Cellulophaga baltica]|jgi:AGCS family alanine or glycine:cation symporter|uniref:Alanine or glycine:cation symporter, AGCS family n=2 Tax=Cellulophaga baltica TaxID=76594 RepID=A0A1G7KQG2_9FLAO|nr:alanine/glycine:cation symporter family protein [Cellulophaga baltica]AIZ41729.1 alanine glycine permease [Cellulophaga baltica 18]MBA6316712.1 alanine:cation symporter family protein [Cellulophaga baltica]WFO17850.1 alanine:cation symporter family protein [Cellulophaga baltica 4]SDF39190.1 alanine or glycine:cation symporter, AGCS family [Cellulophaga baltica]